MYFRSSKNFGNFSVVWIVLFKLKALCFVLKTIGFKITVVPAFETMILSCRFFTVFFKFGSRRNGNFVVFQDIRRGPLSEIIIKLIFDRIITRISVERYLFRIRIILIAVVNKFAALTQHHRIRLGVEDKVPFSDTAVIILFGHTLIVNVL